MDGRARGRGVGWGGRLIVDSKANYTTIRVLRKRRLVFQDTQKRSLTADVGLRQTMHHTLHITLSYDDPIIGQAADDSHEHLFSSLQLLPRR